MTLSDKILAGIVLSPALYYLAAIFREIIFKETVSQVVAWTSPQLRKKIESQLSDRFSFYQLLDDDEKSKFINRTQLELEYKTFQGRNKLEITDEIAIMFCAVWVQLTFGLEKFLSPEYSRVVLYPDEMISRTGRTFVSTLNNQTATIQIAWKSFESGYLDSSDNINPGISAFSRILINDYFLSKQIQPAFEAWTKYADEHISDLNQDAARLFNGIVFENSEELWFSCCEIFFESPIKFREKLPELYELTSKVLNQDLASRMSS